MLLLSGFMAKSQDFGIIVLNCFRIIVLNCFGIIVLNCFGMIVLNWFGIIVLFGNSMGRVVMGGWRFNEDKSNS